MIVSAPNINDLDKLYEIYQADSPKASFEDFIQFLSQESVERSTFLNENCNYKFVKMGSSMILKVSPKI